MINTTIEDYMKEMSDGNTISIAEKFDNCIYPENKHFPCESCGYCEKYNVSDYDVNIIGD